MAEQKSRQFKLNKITLTTNSDKEFDLKKMVPDFKYYESIEAPFCRLELSMVDSVDFNLNLTGGEKVQIDVVTEAADGKGKLKLDFRVYKIGKIIKSERGQLYIIYCCTPEMYNNEINKVFKAFGAIAEGASKDEENLPKHIVKKYLKAPGKRIKEENFEAHSKVQVVSPNWRPVDLISYISDKVTRKSSGKNSKPSGKGSQKQSGFLFYENQRGFQFRSIDGLCEQESGFQFVYAQQGHTEDEGYLNIESIQYPDKANHLRHMRMGTYKTVTSGVSLANVGANNVTANGGSNKSKSSPSGTIYAARETAFDKIFARATPLHESPPFNMPEEVSGEGAPPTRQKIRPIPTLIHQQGKSGQPKGNPDSGSETADTLAVAEYAAARYNLMKAIQLTITVPGNTGICAGDVIKLNIPASRSQQDSVMKDRKFSGKYLIAAHTFTFTQRGCTSELTLFRDSIPKK
jgi:hypothetical protein|tara:strand:- start:198 stop:1580 length:1383 start_codon:yes stop_codon:yes gene_type:complete